MITGYDSQFLFRPIRFVRSDRDLGHASQLPTLRVVSWATLAVGALCLYGYLRRLHKEQARNQTG